jgi:phosphatidylethanolamine-binding protein (PEBP) family uncharacterized protein
MSQPLKVMPGMALLCALALAGCGGGGSSDGPTLSRISFKSAAVNTSIPAQYTCDGKDIAPPLEWGSVPADTNELVVVLVSFSHGESASGYKVGAVDWALAGISPQLHKIAAGEVPQGAHVGRQSDGKKAYSVCPKSGTPEDYQFELWALPASVIVPPRFGDDGAFRVFNAKRTSPAIAHGVFDAAYVRRGH